MEIELKSREMIDVSPTTSNYSLNSTNVPPPSGSWCSGSSFPVRGATLVFFSVSGLAFNIFLLLSIIPNRRLRNMRHLFLIHLAFTGIASSTLTLTSSGTALINCAWINACWFCQLYSYLFSVLVFSSVWTIAGLSWDKYQTIASPLHHSQTTTILRIFVYLLLLWLSAIFLSLPPLVGASSYVLRVDMAMCVVDVMGVDGVNWYPPLYLTLWYFLPFVMVSYCYFHIFRIARSQSSRIAASMVKMGSLIQAPIKLSQIKTIKGRRALGTILYIIGAFMMTFLPFAVVVLVEMFTHIASNTLIVTIVISLIHAAPMTNAIVYGLRNRILRESFISFLNKRSADANEAQIRRRPSVDSLQRRPSSTLRLSVLLRKCAAGPNIPQSPDPSRLGHGKRTLAAPLVSTLDIHENNHNGELIPMWSRNRLLSGASSNRAIPPVSEAT